MSGHRRPCCRSSFQQPPDTLLVGSACCNFIAFFNCWLPTTQERLTHELASAVEALAGARGVLVVVEALHMCMVARGVEKHASSTTTVAARGSLVEDGAARSQLLLSLCLS